MKVPKTSDFKLRRIKALMAPIAINFVPGIALGCGSSGDNAFCQRCAEAIGVDADMQLDMLGQTLLAAAASRTHPRQ